MNMLPPRCQTRDDVIVTKALGLEGTAILATDYEETLNGVLEMKWYREPKAL